MGVAVAMSEVAMIDELIAAVARAGSLTPDQATSAVGGMFRFMAARLPSPLFGELQTRLHPMAASGDALALGYRPDDA